MNFFEKLLSQYGFGVAMAGFMSFLLWMILKWTMGQIERIISSSEKREEISRVLWDAQRKALEEHTECSKSFHQEVSAAHQFQRQEHEQQIKALDKIIDKLGNGRMAA